MGSDYGQPGDRALVPGKLRVFRHFLLDARSGVIQPMSYRPPELRAFGERDLPAYDPPQYGEERGKEYVAGCHRYDPFGALFAAVRAGEDNLPDPNHKAPHVNCSCGFYAHYDPVTDFYPSFRWGRLYSRLTGQAEISQLIVLRGVVEVSGITIMGRLGVRAEKVRIVALAIDWEKHLSVDYQALFEARMEQKYKEAISKAMGVSNRIMALEELDRLRYETLSENINPDMEMDRERAWAKRKLADACFRYGAVEFPDHAQMYASYPKEDVTHLIGDQTPKPLTDAELARALYRTQAAAYAHGGFISSNARVYIEMPKRSGKRQKLKGVKGIRIDGVIIDEAVEIISDFKPEPDEPVTPFERVMQQKRNRPAPPGSGIDRRKRKL